MKTRGRREKSKGIPVWLDVDHKDEKRWKTEPQQRKWSTLSNMWPEQLTGAIIPALMHRIPSELRSEACLGESSTRMGDLLGSPRIAPLFAIF